MRIFVLEDDDNRIKKFKRELIGHNVDYVKTVDIGKGMLGENEYDLIFLDHDLGGKQMVDSTEEETGYQLALTISTSDKNKNTPCIVHSCNPAGSDNILSVLTHALKVPFPSLDIQKTLEMFHV